MAWNGSGTYTRTNGTNSGSGTWAADAAANTKITASNHDTHDEDIATAINACLTKNNETKPTANFDPNAGDSYDLGDATLTWRTAFLSGDLVMKERSDHQATPTAAYGQFWVKDDAPCAAYFTDDAGTDSQIALLASSTFTPTLQDSSESDSESQTYNTQSGKYTKLGDLVFFSLQIVVNSIGTLTSGDPAYIAGLPFTASGNGAITVGDADSLSITAGHAVTGWIANGATSISLQVFDAAGGSTDMTIGEFTAGGSVTISGHYFI